MASVNLQIVRFWQSPCVPLAAEVVFRRQVAPDKFPSPGRTGTGSAGSRSYSEPAVRYLPARGPERHREILNQSLRKESLCNRQ